MPADLLLLIVNNWSRYGQAGETIECITAPRRRDRRSLCTSGDDVSRKGRERPQKCKPDCTSELAVLKKLVICCKAGCVDVAGR